MNPKSYRLIFTNHSSIGSPSGFSNDNLRLHLQELFYNKYQIFTVILAYVAMAHGEIADYGLQSTEMLSLSRFPIIFSLSNIVREKILNERVLSQQVVQDFFLKKFSLSWKTVKLDSFVFSVWEKQQTY